MINRKQNFIFFLIFRTSFYSEFLKILISDKNKILNKRI